MKTTSTEVCFSPVLFKLLRKIYGIHRELDLTDLCFVRSVLTERQCRDYNDEKLRFKGNDTCFKEAISGLEVFVLLLVWKEVLDCRY